MTDAPGDGTVFVPDSRSEIAPEVRLKMYAGMTRARVFEKRAYDLFMSGLVKGTTHLGTGQEAVAAGFSTAMRHDDMVFCTYRGHNHTLLRGAPMDSLMGELLGRESGCCGGKGGSMHLTDVEQHAMGSYAIVGAHLPVAAGTAWASLERGTGQVTVCFFGDGTTNIGAFHESLNIAAVWGLPVVYVCENNLYMEYTPISSVTAVPNPAADRAAAYGLDRIIVDGNDVDAVYRTALMALDRARSGDGPSLIEAQTYRHYGHSRADPGKYRPNEEVEAWMNKDPIVLYRAKLEKMGIAESELARIEEAARAEIDAATAAAKASPEPGEAVLMTDLWADGGSSWRR
ncbi:MAG: thiamine pyrophosphate-dependent dehydrogenase E1 component subunit alpha [Acidimicrobiia bacterium]|nr:thiamine pyrophosphate-dependent dehydrogenase E1 component subunit alpha [Acidimicrobiia bacterium]